MDKELKDKLYESFNLMSRKGRGGTYQYVEWKDVADRMNSIFGINWSSSLESVDVVNNNIIVRVRVIVYDDVTKRSFYQEGFGGAVLDEKLEAGNSHKAAYSKALKDACKKWGVALFLEEEDDQHVAGSGAGTPTIPPGFIGKETGVPPASSRPTVTNKPIVEETSETNATEKIIETPAAIETKPGVVIPQKSTRSAPPKQPAQLKKIQEAEALKKTQSVEVKTTTPSTSGIPKIPTASKPNFKPTSTTPTFTNPSRVGLDNRDLPMSSSGGQSLISDVQKAALQGILNLKGVEYEPLAREAFAFNNIVKEPIPAQDKLTYQEAVFVVKYGNDKFRKH